MSWFGEEQCHELTGCQLMGLSMQRPLYLSMLMLYLLNQGGVLYSCLNIDNTAPPSSSIHGTQYWSAREQSWALPTLYMLAASLHRHAHPSLKHQLVEGRCGWSPRHGRRDTEGSSMAVTCPQLLKLSLQNHHQDPLPACRGKLERPHHWRYRRPAQQVGSNTATETSQDQVIVQGRK